LLCRRYDTLAAVFFCSSRRDMNSDLDGWQLDPVPMLSAKEKLSYGLGDFGANLLLQAQLTFLLFFYTDVFGISAATAGTILLISRILDAFSDPIIGAVADRTESRWGKYRPWILFTALPLAVALTLCFTTPQLSYAGKVVWAFATCNALMILYAANNIPYCALAGVITNDSSERTSLLAWRFICAMSATFIVITCTVKLVASLGSANKASGYQAVMGVWGVLAAVCFGITFAGTRERIFSKAKEHVSLRQDLSGLFRSRPWIALFAIAVLIHIQLALRSGAMLYYFTHFLRREDLFQWFNGVGLAVTMVGVLLANPLAAVLGKRTAFRSCLLLSAIVMASFRLLPPDAVWALFVLQVLFQLAFGPTIPLLWTMMADVADYAEWKTGRRSTALAFASIVFGMKLGLGIGAWLNGAWLDFIGYSPLRGNSPSVVDGVVMLVSIFPATALGLGFVALLLYPMNDRLEKQIREALDQRRKLEGSSAAH
jgi:GPH family glycoside/pentoside/hexuronide:cation symporter